MNNTFGAELPFADDSASKFAVIVAAGAGQRAGGETPKQFRYIAGVPMLWHSVRAFIKADPTTGIVLVLSEDGMIRWKELREKLPEEDRKIATESLITVTGGQTRTESVYNALDAITHYSKKGDLVAVHDAARPLLSPELITRGWERVKKSMAAIPVVALTDSIRKVEGSESRAVDRSDYRAVQTPQFFDRQALWDCYLARDPQKTYTDDASVAEDWLHIDLFEGDTCNMKVTHPSDFAIAEILISLQKNNKVI